MPDNHDALHVDDVFEVTDLNRVRQVRQRARYDRETVFQVLDAGLVAHVAFVDDGRPIVIPMAYGRDGDRLFLHGARKSRIATTAAGQPVSIGVTIVDGLVVARSLFESSMNYRAVVIHGRAREVHDADARLHGMRCISDHLLPGRWDEVRAPYDKELKATVILEVEIEAASAKVRAGPAVDEYEIYDDQVWIGVVPIVTTMGAPVANSVVPDDVRVPASVLGLLERR
jgi:uncharacterized protein